MTPEEIGQLLKTQFPQAVQDLVLGGGHPYAVIDAAAWPQVALFLRDDPRLGFNLLRSISSVDLLADDRLACVYDLMAVEVSRGTELITQTHEFAVRVVVDRKNPHIPSVARIWPAADWHEREAYDLMGIVFDGHPDPRRILLPDDWVGHPLRKDYEFPLEYHGIPATTEYELPNPRH
ncbi:MAG TPA: NADH-quinone oxidoreductase subunit C [Phycisphaerae bacterium]|nr:NADH-quinone oxidoreductase subunit C [Phycisphaerae bacterium]HNU46613.1 NADH-quinone oxidoreductase subunit C [Phycisphaerae bacterium]